MVAEATTPNILALEACHETALAGGKAVNLGILLRAQFPVPGGFVVTTSAYRAARGSAPALPPALVAEILAAYERMGRCPVAVRSSATAEDMAGASMAGQYDTFLHVHDDATLLDAISRCWASLDSPRTRSYLSEHGIDISQVAMAVVVQKLVRADVAGVLFTANPRTGDRTEMLAEATWGLGEALVSGRVQPDVLRLERASGAVIDRRIADKKIMIPPGGDGEIETPAHLRNVACLADHHLEQLWRLGQTAATHFGAEQDIEWAVEGNVLYLLQSRPITTLDDSEAYERILSQSRESLRAESGQEKGPWVRHNLGETLPHPTPLTWSVMKRFMTGAGGFGAMYRLAGFEPSSAVCRDGFLKLIAGRVYMETTAAGGMFFDAFPFRYDIDALRTNPDAAQAPPTLPNGSLMARWKAGRRISAINVRLSKTADDLDQRLKQKIIPEFAAWVATEKAKVLSALPTKELSALWNEREKRVMQEFAPLSLLPSLVEGMVLGELQQFLAEQVWDEDSTELAQFLSSSPTPNMTLRADAGLFQIAGGKLSLEAWLKEFGHRAAGEFDLATPRWREQPAAVKTMADRLAGGANPLSLHEKQSEGVSKTVKTIRLRLNRTDAAEFDRLLDRVWRYIAFREDGKYYLMLGYELLRDVAVEIGKRLGVGADVFYLTDAEMLSAVASTDPAAAKSIRDTIAGRKRDYRAEAKISLPHVIDAEAIATLGAPPKLDAAGTHTAFAVSTGVATGPARIVLSPAEAGDLGKGYVLVCPSTDPNWTPLFVNAAALVLECGGSLSHGAVVAREMGLPAVVLADATRLFADGELIRVDGHHGAVGPADAAAPATDVLSYSGGGVNPDDVSIEPALVPPPPGPKDRRAARLRNIGLVIWGVYLLLAFVLPDHWVYQPSLRVIDFVFWPLVPLLGKPITVAVIAGGVAMLTMLFQRLLTDNERLREAKRRSNLLSKQAANLPATSLRRKAIARLTAPVQARLFGAAMVPLAIALGPMVMTFLWFPARLDPASWNAPPKTLVTVVGIVSAGAKDVTLTVPAPLKIAGPATGDAEDVAPARAALQQMLTAWEKPTAAVEPAIAEQIAAAKSRGQSPAELRAYLEQGVMPRPLNWTVLTPDVSGKWPIRVQAADGSALSMHIIVGDQHPPAEKEVVGEPGKQLAGLRLSYASGPQRFFWTPLSGVTWKPIVEREWNHWDAGWLVVYLLAYLPAMFVSRRVFGVA